METTLPRLYTTKELAQMLGESEWVIQDWVRRRGLPVIKIGNRNRFDLAHVRAWLDAGGDRSSDAA